jgi:hypothetical protein
MAFGSKDLKPQLRSNGRDNEAGRDTRSGSNGRHHPTVSRLILFKNLDPNSHRFMCGIGLVEAGKNQIDLGFETGLAANDLDQIDGRIWGCHRRVSGSEKSYSR